MTVLDEIEQFKTAQFSATRAAVAMAVARWRQVDPDNILESWEALLPETAASLALSQGRAAELGADYVPQVVRAQGVDPDPAGKVNPRAFAGIASDGRPLENLLALPAGQTLNRIGQGQSTDEAMAFGRHKLGIIAQTQMMDAARLSSSVGMTSDRTVTGYRRRLTAPSCDRCTILAGKFYRWNDGFQRHPQCDCIHVAATGPKARVRGLPEFDPKAAFESLSEAEQNRRFTKAGARAIRDGADMNQVVNVRRGMRSTRAYGKTVSTTVVGTSTRASAARIMRRELDGQFGKVPGQRLRRINVPRLTPEQIYADASSREDAIRLLGRFGYLEGSAPPLR